MKPAIRVLSRLAALGVLACAVLVVKSTAQLMGPAALQVDDVDGRQAVAGEVLVKFTHSLAGVTEHGRDPRVEVESGCSSSSRQTPTGTTPSAPTASDAFTRSV